MELKYGFVECEWTTFILGLKQDKICFLGLVDNHLLGEKELKKQYPCAQSCLDQKQIENFVKQHKLQFKPPYNCDPSLFYLQGTDFQKKVWEAMLKIPAGEKVSYLWLAQQIEKPKAARAVGSAVGKNPISLWIPCHRVVRTNGEMGGYRWGVKMKEEIIKSEKIWKK